MQVHKTILPAQQYYFFFISEYVIRIYHVIKVAITISSQNCDNKLTIKLRP